MPLKHIEFYDCAMLSLVVVYHGWSSLKQGGAWEPVIQCSMCENNGKRDADALHRVPVSSNCYVGKRCVFLKLETVNNIFFSLLNLFLKIFFIMTNKRKIKSNKMS